MYEHQLLTYVLTKYMETNMISKFAGYIEFFDKILEFLEKSLSFRDFLEFFRP